MMLIYNPSTVLRNSFFYVYGLIFYILTYAPVSLFQAAIGLVGFLVAYDGVYFFNDYSDWDSDLKERKRCFFKPAIKGTMKRNQCLERAVLNFVIGMPVCFFVSLPFGLVVSMAVLLNVVFSHPRTKLKDTKLATPVMLAMQMVKYSSGWFVFTSTFSGFPFWLMLSISSVYTLVYFLKKNYDHIKDFLYQKKLRVSVLSAIGIFSFVTSLFVYPFKLTLILIFITMVVVTVLFRFVPVDKRLSMDTPINILIPLFIILLLAGSVYADLNEQVCAPIDNLRNNLSESMPQEIKDTVELLQNCTPKNITGMTGLLIDPQSQRGGLGMMSLPFKAY